MANAVYNYGKAEILRANIDLESDTIKVALVTSSYTPNIDTHENFDDITNEVSGTGYTAGGATLANKAVTVDTDDDEGMFDADDVTWASASIVARGAIVYKSTGVASTSQLIGYVDFTEDKTASGGDFVIEWNAEGILNLG